VIDLVKNEEDPSVYPSKTLLIRK